ncbi:MAG: hypothetical protein R2795_07310 [Saprospiraceae bacterium]
MPRWQRMVKRVIDVVVSVVLLILLSPCMRILPYGFGFLLSANSLTDRNVHRIESATFLDFEVSFHVHR